MEPELRATLPGGKFRRVPATRSPHMRAARGRGNRSTAKRLRAALVCSGLSGWTMHAADVPGTPDFFFPLQRVAVFVDGCFWHGCPRCGHVPKTNRAYWQGRIQLNQRRDRRNRRLLRKQGICALRFWEHQLRDGTEYVVWKLVSVLEQRGRGGGTPARTSHRRARRPR